MALVDYSDSEGSDAEAPSNGKATTAQAEPPSRENQGSNATSKSGFKKVVDSSNPHKIRVNLPSLSSTESGRDSENGSERPAKRARTGGGLSDFNSMLPAPKNTAPAGGSQSLLKGRATGLKQGVSLKTGATPAFSREPQPTADGDEGEAGPYENEELPTSEQHEESHSTALPTHPLPEIKTTTKPMMFKPLSVGGKKNAKKKKPPLPKEQEDNPVKESPPVSAAIPSKTNTDPPKPKRSLFSTYEPEAASTAAAEEIEYEPLLDEETQEANSAPTKNNSTQPKPSQPQDLNTLVNDLGLTPAQRRQLFGRNGQASGAQLTHFSVSEEYSNNNAMRASEENAAPVHNPVRSIAPGKHSLQQLVNAATSQKDALEESFASGKRNKKAAGSKYGW